MKLFLKSISALAFVFSVNASASVIFDSGLPAGWDCTGNCGTLGANGDVTSSPLGGSYGWVSTDGGANGVGLDGLVGVDGSILRSSLFSADANDPLEFFFNYITSDGQGFADYAWAALLDESLNHVATLFTARTLADGTIVPGSGMPAPEAILTPTSVPIIDKAPIWAPLGGNSGDCYSGVGNGCGYTGWINSFYTIANAGNYYLEFGVTNWTDSGFDSGMAFDGITVGGKPVVGAPEPTMLSLFALSLLGFARRKSVK